jgi:long-chain fatty acid transport protein
MKTLLATAGAAALIAGTAQAGGIDRTRLSYGILFEKGTYAELGISSVSPTVSGTYSAGLGGTGTGDMAPSYTTYSFAYKRDISEQLSYGVFLNTPYGANALYTQGPYTGLTAEWKSTQLALILKYSVTPNISVYGGAKVEQASANIVIPDALIRGGLAAAGMAGNATAGAIAAGAPAGTLRYTAKASNDLSGGVILGAAYEKPEIAARVGLTYESGYSHKFATTENIPAFGLLPGTAPFPNSTTTIKIPYSLTLDFQTGVAKDTLVFGSIRHANWAVWKVRPAGYAALTGQDVTGIDNDVTTFQLGVGRRLNENLSVFARATYEKSNGGVASRLQPTDGTRSIGIGATYTKDRMKITAGLEYAKLGDAIDGSGTVFKGSKAVGAGVTVGFRF